MEEQTIKQNFARNLHAYRKSRHLTQSQLAEKAGVNVRMIQHYEQGYKNINTAQAITVYRIAEALGCTVGDLLEIEEDRDE